MSLLTQKCGAEVPRLVRSIVHAEIHQCPAGIILAESVDVRAAESRITDLALVSVPEGLLLGKTRPLRRVESTFPDHGDIRHLPKIVVKDRIFDHLRNGLLVALADSSFELRPERCETVIAPRRQRRLRRYQLRLPNANWR